VAFAIPGIAMAIATLIFWSGRRATSCIRQREGTAELDPETARQNRKILWAIAGRIRPSDLFLVLYDQQNTTWVTQGTSMVEASIPLYFVQYPLTGETMQTVNAVFILLFIPLFSYVIYPWMRRQTWNPSLLGRMAFGMFIIALAFAWAAWLQSRIDAGEKVSILWQIGQYALLTFAEVLVSTTGLEFAFRKAPVTMKSTIMSLWLLAVAAGNFVTGGLSSLNSYTDAAGKKQVYLGATAELIGYIGIILVAVIVFIPLARRFDRQFPDQPLDAER
jgi:POT family proton-dependent oligopeptide transporter